MAVSASVCMHAVQAISKAHAVDYTVGVAMLVMSCHKLSAQACSLHCHRFLQSLTSLYTLVSVKPP